MDIEKEQKNDEHLKAIRQIKLIWLFQIEKELLKVWIVLNFLIL